MSEQRASKELLQRYNGQRNPTDRKNGIWCKHADAIEIIERLRDALAGLSDMYAHAWDRADGALVMMPESVKRFEAAHEKARAALGRQFVDDAETKP